VLLKKARENKLIRKYRVAGKQVYLTSTKREGSGDGSHVSEILMPVEVYWKIRDVLKDADYGMAAGEDANSISELHRKVFAELKKYAVHEKDRVWLHERSTTS